MHTLRSEHPTGADPVTTRSTVTSVDIWVDPICPFAWLTSRWLLEVEQLRPVAVRFGIMSLSVLNDGRTDLSEHYASLLEQGWGPVRVSVAVEREHGSDALRRFYGDLGHRHHVERRPLDRDLLIEALAAGGLPTALADRADAGTDDDLLRADHRRAVEPVGDDVGTPILHITPPGGTTSAIFGPVVSSPVTGADAAALWDGVVALCSNPAFHELKRTRTGALTFT